MKINLELPDYDGRAADVLWEGDATVRVEAMGPEVVLSADRAGLISLAKQMLYLADESLPAGSHVHYDDLLLDEGSNRVLIIEKRSFPTGKPE